MAEITLGGNPIHTSGELPAVGSVAPAFTLTAADFSTIDSAELVGQRIVLNIFPSMDTSICANSVRTFNKAAAGLDNTTVLCVSADLPTAAGRFCSAEGIEDVRTASTFKSPDFATDYGVLITDGKLEGLAARSVVVIDESGRVAYTEQVPEIAQEPDYDAALAALG